MRVASTPRAQKFTKHTPTQSPSIKMVVQPIKSVDSLPRRVKAHLPREF